MRPSRAARLAAMAVAPQFDTMTATQHVGLGARGGAVATGAAALAARGDDALHVLFDAAHADLVAAVADADGEDAPFAGLRDQHVDLGREVADVVAHAAVVDADLVGRGLLDGR